MQQSMKKNITTLLLFISLWGFSQEKWSLRRCVDYAVENNLQVIANQYNKKIQESSLKMARNEYLPSVTANVGNSMNFGQTQGFQGSIGRNDNFNNSANIGASVLVYNGNRVGKTIRKTQYDVAAAGYDLETVKNNISLQIVRQYLSILLSKEVLKINQSALDNAQKLYDRAVLTTQVGTTAQTVLAEAEAALAREKQNFTNAEIEIKRNLFALVQTLQLKEYEGFDVEDFPVSHPIDAAHHYTLPQVAEEAYRQQPQILAAESRIKAAEAQTEIAKTAFYPTITANAGIGSFYFNSLVTNTTGIDMFGNILREKGFFEQYKTNFSQQIGLSVHLPIFNKGNTKQQVEQAKINEDIARNNLNIQKQELLQSIQKAFLDLDTNYENYQAAVVAEKSTRLALDFAEKSYHAGKSSIYDLNIARNNYANAQGTVAQSKYNFLFSMRLLEFYAEGHLTL